MVRIPGASFVVGISAEQDFRRWCLGQGAGLRECDQLLARAKPRPSRVEAFDVDRTEVTASAFADWLNQQLDERSVEVASKLVRRASTKEALALPDCHGLGELHSSAGRFSVASQGAQRPVICVSHIAAAAFCESAGKRLPSEDEWELAAGGSEKRWLPWDATGARPACSDAVFGRGSSGACSPLRYGPEPVDAPTSDVTPEGVVGLSGNVSEWVAPAPGQSSPVSQQIIRGGSWSGLAIDLHPSKLTFLPAEKPDAANVGFRCARSVKDEGDER